MDKKELSKLYSIATMNAHRLIDELYEKQQRRDLRQVSIFNKILNRIHHRIRITSRAKKDKHIWFTIPEYIFGEPVYKKEDCIAYIIAKLEANKFHIRYVHPNTIFVSWACTLCVELINIPHDSVVCRFYISTD